MVIEKQLDLYKNVKVCLCPPADVGDIVNLSTLSSAS